MSEVLGSVSRYFSIADIHRAVELLQKLQRTGAGGEKLAALEQVGFQRANGLAENSGCRGVF